ncbi:hypothetical protein ASD11_05195 [Aeromicrobium sp. Root495]|uniref:hypothetical protein n=1 Tax=Aeromicrobium sp. Root495 TaxID=1736550 RepID=UPI000701DC51|nr:hypothetical protein [Aeromicrobium sp. Root495]KQY59005.1 hypothetical protein ASD11_05195 [Aeromicrobium sp. Root495]
MPEGPQDPEAVGSLGRELAELLRTMGSQAREAGAFAGDALDDEPGRPHAADRCPHGWCPLCHVVELVQDHPEVASAVLDSAVAFARSVRDAFDLLLDHQRPEGGPS